MDFKYIALICSLLLLVLMLWKEYQRPNKSRLYWRIIASIFMIIGLLFLLIPIKYSYKQTVKNGEITFLTQGTSREIIPSGSTKLFSSDKDLIKSLSGYKVSYVPDLSYYLASHPDIKKINLVGEGLSLSELESIKNYPINFYPSPLPVGFQSCNWNTQVNSNQQLIVQGIYHNDSDKDVKILLKGLGTHLDSVTIKANTEANFQVQEIINNSGKSVYQLIALQGKDTLANEDIPFQVTEKPLVKILILASSPDFEYKFLKNWLLKNHYPLAYRSRISKEKYSTDFMNFDAFNLSNINQSVLNRFDLVIADDVELANLNSGENAVLRNQFANGMGLIIRFNGDKLSSALAKRFSLISFADAKDKAFEFNIGEGKKFKGLTVADPAYLQNHETNQPIVKDGSGKVWLSSQLYGSGRILLTTIPNTFNWFLNGDERDYSSYWSALVEKSAQQKDKINSLKLNTLFPKVNEMVKFKMENKTNNIPKVEIGDQKLPPLQNQQFPTEWQATFWPTKVGWDSVKVGNETSQYFYIYPKDGWKSLTTIRKIAQTQNFVHQQINNISANQELQESEKREVSKWWFFFLFLISSGYLWYESRKV